MSEGFIIMQIGDADLDQVCDTAFVPAIEKAGLVARRVDRHNSGDLLKSEIVAFIERSDIIVADLTNERPNCYLEVGYAMGLGKKKNLILTAREDHHHGSPNYRHGNPKIHFDLEGYDILFWDPQKLEEFRDALEQRIRRRLAIVQSSESGAPGQSAPQQLKPTIDIDWLDEQRAASHRGLQSVSFIGYMEVVAALNPKGDWKQRALLDAVDASQIKTFGWPIGIILDRYPYRPNPTAAGVVADIAIADGDSNLDRASYDHWAITKKGDFYTLRSLFEDTRGSTTEIFFNTRIVQVTELVMFLSRLYSRLGVAEGTQIEITLTHSGLSGRRLNAVGNRLMFQERTNAEPSATASLLTTISQLDTRLVENVKQLLEPMFTLFDFFEVPDATWGEIVNNFVAGKVI